MGNYNLFGFLFRDKTKQSTPMSFAPPANEDGAVLVEGGGYATVVDLDGIVKSEIELITKYRETAQRPEVEGAISEIVNESITMEEQKSPISVVTDKLNYEEGIIKKIQEEFETVLNLLDFNNEGQDLFRKWYIDGRLFFHIIIDPENPRDGIQELRYIDPRRIKPIIETESWVTNEGVPMQTEKQRYYSYNQFGTDSTTATNGVKIAWDSICHVHSGIQETNNTMILSHIHKALKPSNMLSMCLVGDTLISTPTGQVKISDLKAGDSVWCFEDGKVVETKVKRQWSNGKRKTIKVVTTHNEVECTPEHRFLTSQSTRTSEFFWKEAQNLTSGDWIVSPKIPSYGVEIPIPDCSRKGIRVTEPARVSGKYNKAKEISVAVDCSQNSMISFFNGFSALPVEQGNLALELYDWNVKTEEFHQGKANLLSLPSHVTPKFAKLFGFLLGDGTVSNAQVTFAEGEHEKRNQYYKKLMEQFFGPCYRHNSSTRKYTRYCVSSVVAAETLKALEFAGDSHTKRFPNWIFNASPENRRAMVDGFLDADGYKKSNVSYSINLCNKELLEDIKRVWTSLGLSSGNIKTCTRTMPKSTLKSFDGSKEWTSYRLHISTLELPFFERVKSTNEINTSGRFDTPKSTNEINTSSKNEVTRSSNLKEVFDIEVTSKSHSFCIMQLISHNCEDASVIYRLSRAPERRIFYIDVGNLPKQKAEQYLKDISAKYRNKMVYDACLSMETKVPLLDGRTLSLSDISDEFLKGERLWAYSTDPNTGRIAPGLITSAGITKRNQKVVKITFNNNKSLTCTLDHKFPVWTKGKVEAKDLTIGDSIISFDKMSSGTNNEQVYDHELSDWKFTNQMVSDWKEKNNLSNVVETPKDNTPENLLVIDSPNLVHMANGTRVPISSIQVGDKVLSYVDEYNNKTIETTVLSVSRRPIIISQPIFKLKTQHSEIICTGDQKFLTKRATKEIIWKSVSELAIKKDNLVLSPIEDNGVSIPIFYDENKRKKSANAITVPEFITSDLARLFGFLVGDGYVINGQINFAEGERPDRNKFYQDLMTRFFGNSKRQNFQPRTYTGFVTTSVRACDVLESLEWKNGSHEKRIPSWVYKATHDVKLAFIQGFLDADGYQSSPNNWAINLCNKELLEDIKQIWSSLGYCSGAVRERGFRHCKLDGGSYNSYYLYISNKRLGKQEKVLSIEEIANDNPIYELEINHPCHNFIMNNVVIHNNAITVPCREHKSNVITNIELLSELCDVGTLSIDREDLYLDCFHTFALDCGVFTYNSTGEIREDKKYLSFMEDYWLPRREGGKGTEIATLEGGQNLGEIADIEYFKEKLYQSLNVPVSRLKSESTMSFGDGATITREEVKFGKFIFRLRSRFTILFDGLLSTQLMLKGIITKEDWGHIRQKLFYNFLKDTYYTEMKNLEIIQSRVSAVDRFVNYAGKLVSWTWVRRMLLQQTDEEMKQLDAEMDEEKNNPRYQALEALGGMPPEGMDSGGQDSSGMDEGNPEPQPEQDEENRPSLAASGGNNDSDDQDDQDESQEEDSPVDRTTKNVESLWRR